MKFQKYKKALIHTLFFILVTSFIALSYSFYQNQIAFICFLTALGVTFIIWSVFSIKFKSSESNNSQTLKAENKSKINKFLKNNTQFQLNQNHYTKTITYKNSIVLKTNDWLTFQPVYRNKKGRKITNASEAVTYLRQVTYRKFFK